MTSGKYFLTLNSRHPTFNSDELDSGVFWVCDTVIVFYTCILIDHLRVFQSSVLICQLIKGCLHYRVHYLWKFYDIWGKFLITYYTNKNHMSIFVWGFSLWGFLLCPPSCFESGFSCEGICGKSRVLNCSQVTFFFNTWKQYVVWNAITIFIGWQGKKMRNITNN